MNKKFIIVGMALILILLVIIFLLRILDTNEDTNPSVVIPTDIVSPTITKVPIITSSQLPANIYNELKEPVKFEDITIDFRPTTETFVIYYSSEISKAQDSFQRFLINIELNDTVKTEYRSLIHVTLPPRVNINSYN